MSEAQGDAPPSTTQPRDTRDPRDLDSDGMPDIWNARMPAIAFVTAMVALLPVMFGMKSAIWALRDKGGAGSAYVWNIVGVVFATGAIIAAAFGAQAKTKGLASAAQKIGIGEILISIFFIIMMFFTT